MPNENLDTLKGSEIEDAIRKVWESNGQLRDLHEMADNPGWNDAMRKHHPWRWAASVIIPRWPAELKGWGHGLGLTPAEAILDALERALKQQAEGGFPIRPHGAPRVGKATAKLERTPAQEQAAADLKKMMGF